MGRAAKAILFGVSLLCMALLGRAEREPASSTQDQQSNQAGLTATGIKPRASAARYASHGELSGIGVGARLLTRDEVRQEFTSNLDVCCVVLEVALFPPKGKPVDIARQDFMLRVAGTKKVIPPSSPGVLASGLEISRNSDGGVHGSVGVGVVYAPGQGTPGGQPGVRTIDTSAEISVGTPPDRQPKPPDELDRELIELELTKKGLPEGTFSAPVAGYLYFPRIKKKKNATRQLDCTLAGEKIALAIP